jgi:hypothetical protein
MNNEPVAWLIQYKDRHKFVFEKPLYSEHILACEPLYTHPAKTLTDEEITNLFRASSDHIEFARAILRKAQEK